MNKPLKRIQAKCWYFVDGKKIGGTHDQLSGDVGRLRAYGNAINFVVAREFIAAAMECLP